MFLAWPSSIFIYDWLGIYNIYLMAYTAIFKILEWKKKTQNGTYKWKYIGVVTKYTYLYTIYYYRGYD